MSMILSITVGRPTCISCSSTLAHKAGAVDRSCVSADPHGHTAPQSAVLSSHSNIRTQSIALPGQASARRRPKWRPMRNAWFLTPHLLSRYLATRCQKLNLPPNVLERSFQDRKHFRSPHHVALLAGLGLRSNLCTHGKSAACFSYAGYMLLILPSQLDQAPHFRPHFDLCICTAPHCTAPQGIMDASISAEAALRIVASSSQAELDAAMQAQPDVADRVRAHCPQHAQQRPRRCHPHRNSCQCNLHRSCPCSEARSMGHTPPWHSPWWSR